MKFLWTEFVANLLFATIFLSWTCHASLSVKGTNLNCGDHFFTKRNNFLTETYRAKDETIDFAIRQVPGDGGCLFHALSACLSFIQTRSHREFDWRMRKLSQVLRHLAVDILQSPNVTLSIENGETTEASSLLRTVADVYNIEPTEYCKQILDPRTWGGGPEIVALSNHFKCPIHVYQLSTDKNVFTPFKKEQFQLQICAKFGSPVYDFKSPLRILCADGRFPNISPGKQKAVGDHFLALFPVNTGSVGNTNVDSNFPVNMHMHSGTVDAAKVAAPVSDSLSLKEDGSSRKVRFCDPIRRVFNTLQSSLLWRCKGRNGVARSRSVQCLMRDCPVMSADETFRDWYI